MATYTSSNACWGYWNEGTADSSYTTTTYTSGDTIWYEWNTSCRDYNTSSTDQVWTTWTSDSYTVTYVESYHKPFTAPKRSRAEETQQEINRIWNEILAEELQAEKEEAENVAMELLGDLIGDDQLEIYRKTGRLLVHGNKHDWLVRKGGIIAKVEKGKLIDHCVHLLSRYSYPPTDNVITLALRIKENESEVERIANRHASPKQLDEIKLAANF